MTVHFEKLTNLILLKNNLYHIHYELDKTHISFFRIGKESHQVLYRAMVEALKGTANLSITGRPKNKNREVGYKIGDGPYLTMRKIGVNNCKSAWRFSKPVASSEPKFINNKIEYAKRFKIENYLKSFFDFLAMVQTECFMLQYCHSKPFKVSDQEMEYLEWLNNQIRNEFEHFIPKYYSAAKYDLMRVSLLCLKLASKLLYESGNIYDIPRGIKSHLLYSQQKLKHLKTSYKNKYL